MEDVRVVESFFRGVKNVTVPPKPKDQSVSIERDTTGTASN